MPKGQTLSKSDVGAIRWRLHLGHSKRDIAREFGVVSETIAKIGRGDTWPDVPMIRPEGLALSAGEKLDAELLAPRNLEPMLERLLKTEAPEPEHCPACEAGMPLVEGSHETPYGVMVKCLRA